MVKLSLTAIAATALTMAAVPATAATVTFDTTPGGSPVVSETLITGQYASLGVTFLGIYDDNSTAGPVATNYAGGPEGPNYQGNYLGNAQTGVPFVVSPTFSFTPRFQTLRISFANGANNISLSHNDFALVTQTTFNAYDVNGALLQTFTVNDGNGWAVRTLSASNVYRLDLVASVGNVGNNYFGIDNLNFTPLAAAAVPEMATWTMMIAGFGGIGFGMRRRSSINTTVSFAETVIR